MRNRPVTQLPEITFHALADRTRLAVLDLLRVEPKSVGQIASAFPISRPTISKHLRQLHNARLVFPAGDATIFTGSTPSRSKCWICGSHDTEYSGLII